MPYDLRSPVTEKELAGLDSRPEVIQFSSALTEADYALLGQWFATQPTKTLRAYGSYDGTITNLEFLRHFPSLRSFQADALYNSLESLDGLGYLPDDVHFIGLGRTKKRLSLAPLARFTKLRPLYLEGQSKDIGVISDLNDLRSVTHLKLTPEGGTNRSGLGLVPWSRHEGLRVADSGDTDVDQIDHRPTGPSAPAIPGPSLARHRSCG